MHTKITVVCVILLHRMNECHLYIMYSCYEDTMVATVYQLWEKLKQIERFSYSLLT